VAISLTFRLPDQPAAGTTTFIPLGGDGWTSPQSAFLVQQTVTGDATGARVTLECEGDHRFEHLVSLLMFEARSATAVDYLFDIHRSAPVSFRNLGQTPLANFSSLDITSVMWAPPPIIDPTKWVMITDNVDTIPYTWTTLVYNFNIRASEKVPLSVLFASLPRAPSAI